jgi:hypothetical protein
VPAEDHYHDTVIRALEKDGWVITREQVPIRVGLRRIWIDLQATKPGDLSTIFAEVKELDSPSAVESLRDAIGQYVLYRAAMRYVKLDDEVLYLVVPSASYEGIISETLGELAIREARVNGVVFDPETKEIIQWIPYTN